MITVLRGEPDEEELAAVTVALLMLAEQSADEPPRATAPGWTGGAFTPPGSWAGGAGRPG